MFKNVQKWSKMVKNGKKKMVKNGKKNGQPKFQNNSI